MSYNFICIRNIYRNYILDQKSKRVISAIRPFYGVLKTEMILLLNLRID